MSVRLEQQSAIGIWASCMVGQLAGPLGARTVPRIMKHTEDTYRKGLTLLNRLHGGEAGEQMVNAMKDVCPDFSTMTIEWAMAGIMARPGLELLTREYVVIAAC